MYRREKVKEYREHYRELAYQRDKYHHKLKETEHRMEDLARMCRECGAEIEEDREPIERPRPKKENSIKFILED